MWKTAVISVSGTETDYRLAPATRTYIVFIDKATPVFSFEKPALKTSVGDKAPENKLNIGLYDGQVTYTSSNDTISTVDAQGVVTALATGEVTITATGIETQKCYEPVQASYTLTVDDSNSIVGIDNNKSENIEWFDLQGRRVNPLTVPKGIYTKRSSSSRKVLVR